MMLTRILNLALIAIVLLMCAFCFNCQLLATIGQRAGG